ncbi:IS1/IS1595 family N-terminal zinc-binding domain-containing protein [Spirosoma spitsbergense]|uniref:IS1/IS1595 family N-terminal zinc-binding domain-containing protein n=1 Tax=Spirosoma spitsbergense TaxID=431554 RepID=UPI003CCBBA1C
MYQQDNCPNCGSTNLVKNGSTYYGKARPHGFPWFMQGLAYNFCYISAGGELPSKPDELAYFERC